MKLSTRARGLLGFAGSLLSLAAQELFPGVATLWAACLAVGMGVLIWAIVSATMPAVVRRTGRRVGVGLAVVGGLAAGALALWLGPDRTANAGATAPLGVSSSVENIRVEQKSEGPSSPNVVTYGENSPVTIFTPPTEFPLAGSDPPSGSIFAPNNPIPVEFAGLVMGMKVRTLQALFPDGDFSGPDPFRWTG